MKQVTGVNSASFTDFNGLDTFRVMPTRKVPMERMDPFIFLNHHGPQEFVPNNRGLPFGPHPHKGFETVTFILKNL
jgi:redox-sensitive bicupin YhaK (pirin superfamily)